MPDTSSAFGYGALFFGPETTFGTDPAPATYIEVIKWGDDRARMYFENDVVKQGLQQHTSGVVGHKSDSTAELEMYLHGYSSAAVSSAPNAGNVHPDSRLLAAALGGYVVGGYDGTGVTAGTTVDSVNCTSTASFKAGQCVLVGTQACWIKRVVSPTNFTTEHSLEWVPANGTKIYGSVTCFPRDSFDATTSPSLAFKWEGLRADDVIKYLGVRPSSCKITGAPKDFLRMSLGFAIADYEREDTGGDPEPQTYAFPAREEIVGARLVIQENTGAVPAVEVDCSKFELDFGLGLAPRTDINAYEGVSEWRKTATECTLVVDPVQGIESTSAGWEFLFESQYQFTVMLQVGTVAGQVISICLPAGEITEFPKTTDREGLNAKSLKFKGMAHTRDTGDYGDAYCTNKVCKVAFC